MLACNIRYALLPTSINELREPGNPDKLVETTQTGVSHSGLFFVNFGLEIEIGNQQVWGKNWVSKEVINKYLSNES